MSRWICGLGIVVFITMSTTMATADVLFDHFFNVSYYDTEEPSSDVYGPDSGNELKSAYKYHLSSAQHYDYALDSVEIAVLVDSGLAPGISVSLCVDNGGVGDVLETITVSDLPVGTDMVITACFCGTTVMTDATDYWFLFEATGDTEARLLENWLGVYIDHAFQPGVEPWYYNNIPAPAMRIEGTPVPEPATLGLLGVGGLVLLFRKRRR